MGDLTVSPSEGDVSLKYNIYDWGGGGGTPLAKLSYNKKQRHNPISCPIRIPTKTITPPPHSRPS